MSDILFSNKLFDAPELARPINALREFRMDSFIIVFEQNKRGMSLHMIPSVGIHVQAVYHSPEDEFITDPRIKFPHSNSNSFTIPFSFDTGDAVEIVHTAMKHVFNQPLKEDMPPTRQPYLNYSTLDHPAL